MYRGSSCVVARLVSIAPGSSLEISTITEPFSMRESMFRVMRNSLFSFCHLTQLRTISIFGNSSAICAREQRLTRTRPLYCAESARSLCIFLAMTVQLAPSACKTCRAPLPTFPLPRISAWMPGSPAKPPTYFPFPPWMVSSDSSPNSAPCFPAASQFGEPYRWESSAVNAMQPLFISASTSSGFAAGCRQPRSSWPVRISGHSSGVNSLTLATISQILNSSCTESVRSAPADSYASSEKPARSPQPRCA